MTYKIVRSILFFGVSVSLLYLIFVSIANEKTLETSIYFLAWVMNFGFSFLVDKR